MLVFDADGDGPNDVLVTKAGTSLPAGAPEYSAAAVSQRRPRGASSGAGGRAAGAADQRRGGGGGGLRSLGPAGGVPRAGGCCRAAIRWRPRSALLANRGGRFEDVTDALAPGLREVGMVSSALWSDVDGDGWPDLLLAAGVGPGEVLPQ